MVRKFFNREDELRGLEDRYGSKEANLFILYGRRRVGKTELVKEFSKGKPSFYFLAKKEKLGIGAERLKKRLGKKYDIYIEAENIEGAIKEVINKLELEEKLVFVIDEFPYWIEENKGVVSDFQHLWDEFLKHKNVFLILTGSSVGMIETEVLGYKSPLYGRRTGQLKLGGIPLNHFKDFLPSYDMEEIFKTYGALGGVPFYLEEFDPGLSFFENVRETFLNKLSILHEEAEILLRQELRKPNIYFNIIKAILDGATTLSEISDRSKVNITNINKYIKVLDRLGIVRKEYPVTEPAKQKNFLYKIKDNYFRFWLSYIYPNKSDIEENPEGVLESIKDDYNRYMGSIFEDICRKTIKGYQKVGKWWYKDEEIDITALNEKEGKILLGECKWSKSKVGTDLLKDLKRKAKKVRWKQDKREETYALFLKSGFTKELEKLRKEEDNLELFDLKRLEEVFS